MFDGREWSVAMATVAATVIILMLLVLINRFGAKDEKKRYPPSLPILSLIVTILREGVNALPDFFLRSAEKLGPVTSCKLGGRLVIILNNKKAVTESFLKQSETFADRFEFWSEKNVTNPDLRGIIFARYNENFKKYHKICLSILKEFGLGDNCRVSETRILLEVESMFEEIAKTNGHAFDPKFIATYSTSNVVLSILFSKKFMSVEKNQRSLLQNTREYVNNIDSALDMVPLLRFLPNYRKKIRAVSEGNKGLLRTIEEGIGVSKADDTEPTFVRRFLEIEGPAYNHEDFVYILRDLCFGSLDTMSSALQWAMVELANHAEIQIRLQREVDAVVPQNRFPLLDDKSHLPYAEAFVFELLRRHPVTLFITPHTTLKDTEVLGYLIPKESMVLANIYSTHMDPMTWKHPKNFDPDRFLDSDGNVTGGDKLLPFGLGRRSCPGEILGRQVLFLFIASLVQRFEIRPPEDQDAIRVTEVTTVTMHPSDFKVRLIQRKPDLVAESIKL